jgi:hypothetical protein
MHHEALAGVQPPEPGADTNAVLRAAAEIGSRLIEVSDVELRYVTDVVVKNAGPAWETSVSADIARLLGRMDRRVAFRRRLIVAASDLQGPNVVGRRIAELASAHTPQDVGDDELWRVTVATLVRGLLDGDQG